MRFARVVSRILPVTLLTLPLVHCSGSPPDSPVLTAEMPLHLEDHLDAATIEGSEVPAQVPEAVEWRFDEPQKGWRAPAHKNPFIPPLQMTQTEDALRITLTEAHRDPRDTEGVLHGDIYVPLPDLKRAEWGHVLVRARTSDEIRNLLLAFNLGDPNLPDADDAGMFQFTGEQVPVIQDGSVHTYLMRADWLQPELGEWEDPWQELGFAVNAGEPASIDLLSVTLIPKETIYAGAPVGVRSEPRGIQSRRTLYMHAPGRLEYRVRIPEGGRLDVGLGVLAEDSPITFRVAALGDGPEAEVLLEETYAERERWAQRSVDLSHLAGETLTLVLEADAERKGSVAFWGAPTVSGTRLAAGPAVKPNVIFYVIDGAAAEAMSLYGHNRNTTPNIDRLAREGALFEYAYSNSPWTKPSTRSFMTSLQSSVLGSTKYRFDPLPEEARTMAQRFHDAGYQTGVFTSNPWAGSLSSLQRGVDWFRDAGVEHDPAASRELHQDFWSWREAYPAEPYWVHFQTTDVHGPHRPPAPFAGLFVPPDQYKKHREDENRLNPQPHWKPRPGRRWLWSSVFDDLGIDRVHWFTTERDVYDEVMAHQDYQLGRFIERLKASGDWANTILVIASDHSSRAAGGTDFGLAIQDSLPEQWAEWGPLFRSTISRIPLIVVWPGHIEGGQRFFEAVSMIDVAPTLLELAGLPPPQTLQGESLAPLLLGTGLIESRPIIIELIETDGPTGELHGLFEVVDGRWGASLAINGGLAHPDNPDDQRPAPLLLFDLWNDPWCLKPVNEEHPDFVEKYTQFLEAQWEAHQALATRFTPGGEVALTPEQLETLRALGYIQ